MARKAIGAVFLLLLLLLWFTIRTGFIIIKQQLGTVIGYIKVFVLYPFGATAGAKVKGFSVLIRIVKKGIVHVADLRAFRTVGGFTYSIAVHGIVGGHFHYRFGRDFTLIFTLCATTGQNQDKKG